MSDLQDDAGGLGRRTLLRRGARSALAVGVGTVAFAGTAAATTCPRTPGFWKNHPGAWPVDGLRLGGVDYSTAELLAILDASPAGDKSVILARHVIAYRLNLWELNPTCDLAEEANATATEWLGLAGPLLDGDDVGAGVHTWVLDGVDGEPAKDALDAFNNGRTDLGCAEPCTPWEPDDGDADGESGDGGVGDAGGDGDGDDGAGGDHGWIGDAAGRGNGDPGRGRPDDPPAGPHRRSR